MAITIHIPTPMRQYTAGNATVEVAAATVQTALDALGTQYPDITARMFDSGQLKRFLNLYLNDEDVRYLDNLATPVKDGDELSIIPAVAGGEPMADEDDDISGEVPDGAAVFPDIPDELGIHPLLLATLHAFVFVTGSDAAIVQPGAGDEAAHALAGYLQRLTGPDLRRVNADMDVLLSYAKQQGWPKQLQHFLKTFLADLGVGDESDV